MNYAWEAALMADREGIPREKLRFCPVENGSPYTEVVQENINENTLEDNVVEINPLYRFAGIFLLYLTGIYQVMNRAGN